MPDEPDIADDDSTEIGKNDFDVDKKNEISPESERSYYYDDAHGYEDFDSDTDDEEDAND